MRITPVHTLLAALAVLMLLLSSTAFAAEPIRIGQSIDLSGPNGSLGRDYAAGIKTCFDMLNAAGGIDGRKVDYIVHDDRGEPELAVRLNGELIERERVDYLFGGIGDEVVRAVLESDAFRHSGQVLFAPLAGGEYADDARLLFWRPSHAQEVRHVLAHFGSLGVRNLAVVTQNTAAARQAQHFLQAEAAARGLNVAGRAELGADGERAARAAARIAGLRPDFVLVIADSIGTAQFLKAFRDQAPQTFVAGTSLVNLQTVRELAGAGAMEWAVFSQVVPNPAGGATALQLEHLNMMRKYRDEPVSALTLEGFAAAKALALALQKARRAAPLPELFARAGAIDLGGLAVGTTGGHRLSAYLDIALFRKGGKLVF